jgi:hypothetical protein
MNDSPSPPTTRDLSLPDWGPYSKNYAGISKILNDPLNSMVDFSLLIAYVRGKTLIPDVNIDSGYHHWDAVEDLRYFSYRYELQWKDVETADVAFFDSGEHSRLVKVTFVNNGSYRREYTASLFSVLRTRRAVQVQLSSDETWLGGEDYTRLDYAPPPAPSSLGEMYELSPVAASLEAGYDGLRRGIAVADCLANMSGLGNIARRHGKTQLTAADNRTFLMNPGTRVSYELADERPATGWLYLRFGLANLSAIDLEVMVNDQPFTVQLKQTTPHNLIDFEDLRMARVALPAPQAIKTISLRVLAIHEAGSAPSFVLDGLLLSNEADPYKAAASFELQSNLPRWAIERHAGEAGLLLSAATQPLNVALYSESERPWPPKPYSDATVTSVYHSEMSSVGVTRKLSNDSLTNWYRENCVIPGDGENHFAGYNLSPIYVEPHTSRTVYIGLVCAPNATLEEARAVYEARDAIEARVMEHVRQARPLLPESPYRFSQEREMVQLFTNLVYPIRIGSQYVRTYTPGKRWSSLFTWDSGMHCVGLLEYAPRRALELTRQYLALPDDPAEIGMVLHGTPLPLQVYVLHEIFQQTGDMAMLAAYYPAIRRYQRYLSGEDPASGWDRFGSGLLNPYLAGYNAVGIDDYPPQHYLGQIDAYSKVSPAANTAHAIRATRIVQLFAHLLGCQEDVDAMEAWAQHLTSALQTWAWDEASGYYCYVFNETKEKLFFAPGINFNMGLDGVGPLMAGICTPEQHARLVAHLMTPGEMWSEHGITVVARDAPYARPDGYWNGRVWMPHQWFLWRALITAGELEHAERIALTALRVWKDATDDTYNTWELFDAVTGMGQGTHQFAGLSGPVAAFYHRYHTPGRVTGGFDTVLQQRVYDASANRFSAEISSPLAPRLGVTGPTGLLVVMARPGRYRIQLGEQAWTQISAGGWLNLKLDLGSTPRLLHIHEDR